MYMYGWRLIEVERERWISPTFNAVVGIPISFQVEGAILISLGSGGGDPSLSLSHTEYGERERERAS